MPTIVSAPRAPYSLEPATFSFPALASLAGRAPLGGPRELALACFLLGRIVRDATSQVEVLSSDQLAYRITGAKHWLGSVAIPSGAKNALSRLADAVSAGNSDNIRSALDGVMVVTANQLDGSARLELARLSQAIAG